MSRAWVPVEPREHEATCGRGNDPAGTRFSLDREHCARCRALWERLDEAARDRDASKPSPRVRPS